MKTPFFLFLLVITLIACNKKEPVPCFESDKDDYRVGDVMHLISCSQHSDSLYWQIEKTFILFTTVIYQVSYDQTVDVYINGAGTYYVNLIAYSKNGNKSNKITRTYVIP